MVYALYKQGLTLRVIGKSLGRSHEWARKIIEERIKESKIIRKEKERI